MAYSLGEDQPFRYRGYVYDSDTQLYYLQSRYYDPKIGRFISADVLLSTGQGVIGHNSFAYCGNNPVNATDSTGSFPLLTIFVVAVVVIAVGVTATGCSYLVPEDMDTAYPELLLGSKVLDTETADLADYNCMGYAFDVESNCKPDGWFDGMSSDDLCECLEATFGDGIRPLTSINDKLEPDEYMIAVNCSEDDFHFIRRKDNGDWYEKCGKNGPYQQVSKGYVSNRIWSSRKVGNKQTPKYYSGTRFLAVKKDWRKYLE